LPASEEAFGRIVRRAQALRRLPSVSAAVFRRGEVVWKEALGLANVEERVATTPDTQYRIGSVTKTFTAVAVMQLRDEGRLTLEDTLERHVPGTRHGALTLRGLLSHFSGLQREIPGEIWENLEQAKERDLLETLPEAESVLRPAQEWHYSNLAFELLGEVVQRVSGEPYRERVRTRLLEPLGLARTTWVPEPPFARGYLVEAYGDSVRPEAPTEIPGIGAAGQLWSTSPDLCRWGAFLAEPDPAVLDPETAREMHGFQAMADLETWSLGWGLGIELFRRGDRIFAGHTGGMPGFVTILSYSRKEHVGSVVLMSSGAPDPGEQTGLLLTEKAIELLAEPSVWEPVAEAPEAIVPLLGRWWSEGYEFVFSYREGRLHARPATARPTAPPAVFAPDGDDRFRTLSGSERGELLRVVRNEAGEVEKLYWATYPFTRDQRAFSE